MNDLHIERLEKVADRLDDVAEKMVVVMERQSTANGRIEKLEERLDALRDDHAKWKNRAFGAWAVVTTAFTVVTAFGWHKAQPVPPPTPQTTERQSHFPARTSP